MSDFISKRPAPDKRAPYVENGIEHHFTEGAVMMAFGLHLFQMLPKLRHFAVHPDGEHAKRFDFAAFLGRRGFTRTKSAGSTPYGGVYEAEDGRSILVNPKSGLGDVIADLDGESFIAECKGGIINTRHAGQTSRLRKGLSETIGQLMVLPLLSGQRQFAVVPQSPTTQALAKRLAPRAKVAGIEIALVDQLGSVHFVDA